MDSERCWEVKNCNFGPESEQPCPVVDFTLANGFLGSENGAKICFYVKGTTCFDDDKDMNVPEKMARYCMDCNYFRQMQMKYGPEINIYYYIKFLHRKLAEQGRMVDLPTINDGLFH